MNVARSLRLATAAFVVAGFASACTTSSNGPNAGGATSSPGSSPGSTASSKFSPSAKGVSADTIKLGFSYIDLETLAKSGIIKISHGPYEQIIKTLVEDVNARGGINGRRLQLFTAKYSPIGNTDQLAACTKLTEDDGVFAVLNGLLQDNNLCIVQNHRTILVGGNLNGALLAKAKAPWATYSASDERAVKALVKLMDQNGYLKGRTIAIYAQGSVNKPLTEVAAKALQDAGAKAVDTALFDVDAGDTAAATAQDKIIAGRFADKRVDTVINVGLFTPAADWDASGFHPALFGLSAGNIAAAAFTNPLAKFPIVAGLGVTSDPNAIYNSPEMARCRDVWKQSTGQTIETEQQERAAGRSSGYVAMTIACTSLQIFVAAAKAAGRDLNNQTFEQGLESLGPIPLANTPTASFGPGKPDGQDSFQLVKHDPTWTTNSAKSEFIPIGEPITMQG